MELKKMVCEICGGREFTEKDNKYVCIHCDTVYYKDVDDESEADKEARILRTTRFDDAEKEMRLSPPHFDMAEDKFTELTKLYPEWSAAYWGLLRAKYGIKYEIDFDGKCIPSCYKSSYEDFRKDANFLKALKFAENEEIRAKYKSEGDRIAETCTEWREKAKQFDYDIFISFKATDNDRNETSDLREMQNLYTYLTGEGYKVFFSPVSMRSFVGKNYDAYIFNALEKSSAMILYGSEVDYFSSTWVENEWSRYLRMMQKGKKKPDSLILACDGIDPSDLPRQLRHIQAINAQDKTFYITLTERLAEIFAADAHAPSAIERIKVEGGKVGKKATRISDTVQIMEAGTSAAPKKARVVNSAVSKRNIVSSGGSYVPTADDTYQMGVDCLRIGTFFEAEMFFNECISNNKSNGMAWIGLVCVKFKDSALFSALTERAISESDVPVGTLPHISGCLKELEQAVENAGDRLISENILRYVLTAIKLTIQTHKTGIKLDRLVSFVIRYESAVYDEAVSFIENNISAFASVCKTEEYEKICNELINGITDPDKYIAIAERIVAGYSASKNLIKAKEWNNKILEIDEGNLSAILRNVYFLADVFHADEFKSKKQTEFSAATLVIPYLAKSIKKISKDDADDLLAFVGEVEFYCLRSGNAYYDNAELYFDFVSKYRFATRESFLNSHKEYAVNLVLSERRSFFEKYMAVMNEESVDWHIAKRREAANKLRYSGRYLEAKAMYESIFALEENNFDALNGIFACKIEFNGMDGNNVKWKAFGFQQFEKILAGCSNEADQVSILNQYVTACVSTIRCSDQPVDDCCRVFERVVRYYPESESRTVFEYVDEVASIFLSRGHFDLAKKYANLSITNEPTYNIKARYILLLATLKCRDENEFSVCEQFDKNMPEYKMLLLACKGNAAALQEYVALSQKNETGVVNAHRKQAADKFEREQLARAQKAAARPLCIPDFIAGLVGLIPTLLVGLVYYVLPYTLGLPEFILDLVCEYPQFPYYVPFTAIVPAILILEGFLLLLGIKLKNFAIDKFLIWVAYIPPILCALPIALPIALMAIPFIIFFSCCCGGCEDCDCCS